MEQGENLHAGGQRVQEGIEAGEGLIGLGAAAERLQQGRHQFGQQFARPGRAHGARPAGMPGADGGGD